MKKVKVTLLIAFCIVMSLALKAQDKDKNKDNDYFVGRWCVLVEGTPNGDSNMPLILSRVDGKLEGGIEDGRGGLATKFDKIELKGNNVTVYFNGGGYNCYITLDKKDENTAEGNMMDMFDATATRVIETKE